jgi:hypothetical protein
MRNFNGSADFLAISDFLYNLYQPDNRDGNWFQPIWEYAYTHSMFDEDSVQRIGIWEDDGAIVGVVLYESILGEAFFQIRPDYEHLKPEMLAYAEQHLIGTTDDGKRYLKAYVTDFDTAFERVVQSKGYEKEPRAHRPMSQFVITDPFPPIRLREGFKLKSLADDNNLVKVHRALWRGFNHPGEPSADGIEGRKKMQSGPNHRKDLTIVVEAPNGAFVAFSGLWFESRSTNSATLSQSPLTLTIGVWVLEQRRCWMVFADAVSLGQRLPTWEQTSHSILQWASRGYLR